MFDFFSDGKLPPLSFMLYRKEIASPLFFTTQRGCSSASLQI